MDAAKTDAHVEGSRADGMCDALACVMLLAKTDSHVEGSRADGMAVSVKLSYLQAKALAAGPSALSLPLQVSTACNGL